MANGNFIVQNGLTVGPVTIDAATGNITTTGVLTTTNTSYPAVFADINPTGNITIAGNITVNSTAFVKIPSGTSAQRPASPSLGMIRYNSTISSFEGYGAGSAWSSLGGVKSVDGYAYISAEASAGAGDDVLRFYSGSTGSSTQVMWASAGNISVLPTTAATTPLTGALQVAGGAGVNGALYVGGGITTGTISAATIGNASAVLYGTLNSSSASQPNVTTLAGVTSFGTAGVTTTAAGHLTVSGNLTVNGNTVTIGASTLSITDPIINLGTPTDLSPLVSPTTSDIGIKIHYYDVADSAAFIGRANDTGYLEWYSRGTDTANVFTGTVYGTIKTGALWLANTTAATGTTSGTAGALYVAGGAGVAGAVYAGSIQNTPIGSTTASTGVFTTLTSTSNTQSTSTTTGAVLITGGAAINTGNLYIGGSAGRAITHGGDIIPSANITYNLGSTTAYYNNIYGINFYGTSTTAKYADLAENYQADSSYVPGQVVMFGGAQEVTIATADTTAVAGVVSTNPAHLMNGGLTGPNVVAVALQGRVPCNVIGPVKKGDLLVSAGFGFARTNNSPAVGMVVGKALADFTGAKGQIEVVVGRS